MSGSTPVHTSVRYSYLSSDSIWLAKHDGLLNLAVIILIAANFRLLLENLLKYGWRLNFISYIARSLAGRGNLPLVLAFPALVALSLLALASEKLGRLALRAEEQYLVLLSKRFDDEKQRQKLYRSRVRQTEVLMLLLHTLCSGAAFLLPCIVIHLTQADAVPGIFLMLWTLTVVMKLISYAHCHTDLRAAHRRNSLTPGERGAPGTSPEWATLRYPENLTASNMLYYLAAPTLTYQINFPRSPRVRKRWLLRRVLELAAFTGLLLFIANQYLEPAVSNAMKPLSESDWLRVLERVLKLALPNLYAWLCMFYCLFHLYLNILGELTCFGDRVFYQDWWNAATIGAYWRTWNQPVHKWLLRTIYFPAMKHGCNRWWAMILVFLVSAIGHEVVVGVPLHMLRGWAFWGIMLQVPLISLTEKLRQRLKSDTWGNYAFWLTFCIIGQPVCLLMYVHDYLFTHGGYRQLSSNIVGQAAAAGAVGEYLRDA